MLLQEQYTQGIAINQNTETTMHPDAPPTMAKIEQAVRYTTDNGILDPKDYLNGYQALRSLFENKLDFQNSLDVQIGAYAVYGWMPTIMKGIERAKLEPLRAFAQKWKNRVEHKEAIDALKNKEIDLKSINNSVVGTSKFLHFVAPEIFPIWDSRIAAAFGILHEYQINNAAIYPEYCNSIHTYLHRSITWPPGFATLDNVSNVRKLEFCLFQFGKVPPTKAIEANMP